ncbi:MAG: hypothetical protein K6A32_05070 [Bacteroidales bacterium]|nr:hypothetical protein [Bacteroidales bacterium]
MSVCIGSHSLLHIVVSPLTYSRSASHVRSHSLTRQVAQPQTTGRSASCDRSFNLMRMDVHALVDAA